MITLKFIFQRTYGKTVQYRKIPSLGIQGLFSQNIIQEVKFYGLSATHVLPKTSFKVKYCNYSCV